MAKETMRRAATPENIKYAMALMEPGGETRHVRGVEGVKYIRERLREPSKFVPGSFRTVESGSHRVIVGHLKGDRNKEAVAQSIFHPRHEGRPCPECEAHRMNAKRRR